MAILSFAVLSFFFAAVLADSSSSNPLIPTNITSSCSSFLSSLDNNSNFTSCLSPIQNALKAFPPGGNPNYSSSDISSSLDNLCTANLTSQCPDTTITTQLAAFYSACSTELTSNPNTDVKRIYDTLFVLPALRNAMCTKDDAGKYCATELGSSSSSSAGKVNSRDTRSIEQSISTPFSRGLVQRDTNSSAEFIPDLNQFCKLNLVLFFFMPSTDASTLCTSCLRNVLTAFITFESKCPYAPGINNSMILCGQTALYNSVESTCGASFLGGAVQAAGGLSSGLVSSAVARSLSHEVSAAVSAFLGAAAFAAAAF